MGSIGQHVQKITRLKFHNQVFLLAKNRYFVIIAFKMLKMGLEFEYERLVKKMVTDFSQFISVEVKKI